MLHENLRLKRKERGLSQRNWHHAFMLSDRPFQNGEKGFPKLKDTTLKPTLTLLPNKTIWEANPMKKLIPANITSITAVWN